MISTGYDYVGYGAADSATGKMYYAGVFLKEFVPPNTPWAHMDIAGVAHLEKEHAGYDPGATGFGVAMTLEFLRKRFDSGAVARRGPGAGSPRKKK